MKIIIVGYGKIGYTITKMLSAKKGVDVTVVDNDPEVFEDSSEIDAIFISGSALSERTLIEAGAKHADLIVSTTNADETNVLCCIMAKHIGTKYTAARVRNPDYALEFNKLWKELGINMVINPEQQTARGISRLLRYPAGGNIDTFIDGRVELFTFNVSQAPDFFIGKTVTKIFNRKMDILLAVVERENVAIIPNGDFVFQKSDIVRIMGRPSNITKFLTNIKIMPKTQRVMIIGGGRITHYLVELLSRHTIKTELKIIEKDRSKCERLCEKLSFAEMDRHCLFLHGDGTNEEFLLAEEIENMDTFVSLTDRDEDNTIISLYALRRGVNRVITKVNNIRKNMIKDLGLSLGSIVTPQDITSDIVQRYVDGLIGVLDSNIITMHQIFSGEDSNGEQIVQAIEFNVSKNARCLSIPVKDLNIKKGVLIGCIVRDSEIIIPLGDTRILLGDSVVIIAKNNEIHELDDIIVSR